MRFPYGQSVYLMVLHMQGVKENVSMKTATVVFKEGLLLESGELLPELVIQYATLGQYVPGKSTVVWVCHALTANSDVASWWPGMVGEGCLYDPEHHFIICANIIASCYGSSGPLSPRPDGSMYYGDFPSVTIRDMVQAHEKLRRHLHIESIDTCIGGSLGGQQALEWSIQQPDLIKHLILLASNAFHSPWGIAFNESQRMAIQADPTWNTPSADAGQRGMAAARAIALLSYRSYETYARTQSEEDCNKTEGYKAISYQHYQGQKLVNRFNVHTYMLLSKAMDSHHVGRGRGSAAQALSLVKSNTLVIGVSSDLLFPVCEQKYLAQHIHQAEYAEIESLYGHDGFLVEVKKITELLKDYYQRQSN
ncbi:MAG: homoserine O-acetyltransferase [Cytophagaceae bacterium]|nr:homoserine O-acetyltransferase [Cytophagaceae bacterium]